MLAPLSPEDLESPSFIQTEHQLQELWLQLKRKQPQLAKNLITRKTRTQGFSSRLAELLGLPLDYAEPFAGDSARILWNCLWAICTKAFRQHEDYGKTSHGLLNSIRFPVPRRWEYPWAIINSNLSHQMRVLDVGSAWSLFPMFLAKHGHHVTSVDPDVEAMTQIAPSFARLLSVDVNYIVGTVLGLNFVANTFDRVYCISVLEHLEEENRTGERINIHQRNLDVLAIKEMLRVLRPRGLLILTVDWSENPRNKRSYKLRDIESRLIAPFTNLLIKHPSLMVDWSVYSEDLRNFYVHSYPFYTAEQIRSDPNLDASAFGIIMRKGVR